MNQLPNLLKQETISAICYFEFLTKLRKEDDDRLLSKKDEVKNKLVSWVLNLF